MTKFCVLLLVLVVVILCSRGETFGRQTTLSQRNSGSSHSVVGSFFSYQVLSALDKASHIYTRPRTQATGSIEILQVEVKYEVLEGWVPL